MRADLGSRPSASTAAGSSVTERPMRGRDVMLPAESTRDLLPPPTRGGRNAEAAQAAKHFGWGAAVHAFPPPEIARDARNFDPRSSRGQALPALGEVMSRSNA